MSKRSRAGPREKENTGVQFLKSLESKDSKALKYVDPEKYIQHNMHAQDGGRMSAC